VNVLRLDALEGTHPLGFLAALGLLRLLTEDARLQARMAFPDGVAVLESTLDRGELIDELGKRIAGRAGALELEFDDLKESLPAWGALLRQARDRGADDRALRFFGAYATDLATARDGETTKPTALYMTAGQQLFVKLGRLLTEGLAHAAVAARSKRKGKPLSFPSEVAEALFGPWRYPDDQHPLGWDPWAERLYAYQAVAPTTDRRGKSTRAVVWLAYEALPLFPVFASSVGRWGSVGLQTTAFVRTDETRFVWPVWTPFAGIGAIRSLLSSRELHVVGRGPDPEDPQGYALNRTRLRARGVAVVCRAVRADLGTKGYAILRPPEVVPLGGRGER
jgi:hypothetical protein